MKKLFVLLVIALSAIGASGQGVYMVQEGDKFTQGDVITSVSNITLTLSTDGGTFKDGRKQSNWADIDFKAYTSGANNGKVTIDKSVSGTYYKFDVQKKRKINCWCAIYRSKRFLGFR